MFFQENTKIPHHEKLGMKSLNNNNSKIINKRGVHELGNHFQMINFGGCPYLNFSLGEVSFNTPKTCNISLILLIDTFLCLLLLQALFIASPTRHDLMDPNGSLWI